jgi:hypothetical protein
MIVTWICYSRAQILIELWYILLAKEYIVVNYIKIRTCADLIDVADHRVVVEKQRSISVILDFLAKCITRLLCELPRAKQSDWFASTAAAQRSRHPVVTSWMWRPFLESLQEKWVVAYCARPNSYHERTNYFKLIPWSGIFRKWQLLS